MAGLGTLRAEGPITDRSVMEGPTASSNWVLPMMLAVGPAPQGDDLVTLLDWGFQHFVDLRGPRSPDYLSACSIDVDDGVARSTVDFEQALTGTDHDAALESARLIVSAAADAVERGRTAYIHCDDSPAALVAAATLLGYVYGMSALKACSVAAQQHGCRAHPDQAQVMRPHHKAAAKGLIDFATSCEWAAASGSPERPPEAVSSPTTTAATVEDIPNTSPPRSPQGSLGGFRKTSRSGEMHQPPPPPPQPRLEAVEAPRMAPPAPPAPPTPAAHVPPSPAKEAEMMRRRQSITDEEARAAVVNTMTRRRAPASQINLFGGSDPAPASLARSGRQRLQSLNDSGFHRPPTPPRSPPHVPTPVPTPVVTSPAAAPGGYRRGTATASSIVLGSDAPPAASPPRESGQRGPSLSMSPSSLQQPLVQQPLAHSGRRHLDPTSATVTADTTPNATPHSRNHRGRGCGGGESSINLFGGGGGGGDSFLGSSGRRGRACVAGHSEGLTPDRSNAMSLASSVSASPAHRSPTHGHRGPVDAVPLAPPLTAPAPEDGGDASLRELFDIAEGAAPPLALDARRDRALIAGPTPTSHWIVAGRICVGALPRPGNPRYFAQLAAEGFTTFAGVTSTPADMDYTAAYDELAGQGIDPRFASQSRALHFPLKDGGCVTGATVQPFLRFVRDILRAFAGGERIYIHCNQGHGRAGIVASVLLGVLYRVPSMRAVNWCDALHSCRVITDEQPSPQTHEQRTCVISLLTVR